MGKKERGKGKMEKIIGSLLVVWSVLGAVTGITFGQATPDATVTPDTTPVLCDGIFSGVVTDAITKEGIGGATIIVEPGNFTATTDTTGHYVVTDLCFEEYVVRVAANSYYPSEAKLTLREGSFAVVNFELEPVVARGTPSLEPTPVRVCTEANAIEVSVDKLKLTKKKSSDITVTVICEDGSPLEGEEVTAIVRGRGKRVVKVTPLLVTDASGTAVFTVTAKNRHGRVRVIFKVGSLEKQVKVFIRRT